MGTFFPYGRLNRLLVIVATLILGMVHISYAQSTDAVITIIPKADSKLSWQEIQGTAIDIAVGVDGGVAAVDANGNVYQYIHSENNWRPIGSGMSRLTIDQDEGIWGVDRNTVLRQYNGTSWNAVGAGAIDVASDKDGKIYVTTNQSSLAVYDPKTQSWQAIEGQGQYLAVDQNRMIWTVGKNGQVARLLDQVWIGLPQQAVDIATDLNGNIYITSDDGRLLRWGEEQVSWEEISGVSDAISIASGDGQLWVTDRQGRIFARGITDQHRNKDREVLIGESGGSGATSPAETPDTSPYNFTKLPDQQTLAELTIGIEGSVYGLTASGDIKRWSNADNQFNTFPGRLEQIEVQKDGLPIGIGTADNLVEHDGVAWRQTYLNVALNDLSLYQDDRILSLTNLDQVAHLTEDLRSYQLLRGKGKKIAAKKDGSFWTIDSSNRLFNCDTAGNCQRQSINATDLDIGPADSVFIVDEANNLRRFNRDTGQFDLIRGKRDVARIALGPNDRPWFISTSGQVFYTDYFERDESQDRNLASASEATASVTETDSGTSSSGIQIVQNISFTSVTIPTSTSNFGNVGSGLRDITSSMDDVVIASGYDDPCSKGTGRNWIYNSLSSSFAFMDYLNRADIMVGLATQQVADYEGEVFGDKPPTDVIPNIEAYFGIWANNCSMLELLEYVPEEFTDATKEANNDYEDAVLFTPLVAGTTSDLDIAKDGRIAFINSKNELKHFYPQDADGNVTRTDMNYLRVGMGADQNDLWIVDTSNNVYEYNQSSDAFILRSVLDDDKAQDIAVGFDGTVFIVNMDGTLKEWSETSGKFIKTNKTGVTRVAVDSRGRPIVANFPDSQIVYFGR